MKAPDTWPRRYLVIVAVAAGAAVAVLLARWFGFSWYVAFVDAFFQVFTTAIMAVAVRSVLMNYFPQSGKLLYAAGVSMAMAALSTWLFYQAMLSLLEEQPYLDFLYLSLPVRALFSWGVILSVASYQWLMGSYREQQQAEAMVQDTENMIRDAELQKLQLQLQPHFLFNSLNSINALILTRPPQAREMVQQLSDFLRATLKRADEQWITVQQELDYLALYLAIERVRFGHRLEVVLSVDDQLHAWLIPPLILQPLVENAIKFGLYGTTEAVTIHFALSRVHDGVVVTIRNPFDADMQPPAGSGFGLSGLRRRLYLMYARNDLLKTETQGSFFTVQLTLPEKV